MADTQRLGGLDLDSLTESDVAVLFGVHVTTLRRWHKHSGLPQHGERGARRYKWPEVRDRHLLYRVRTACAGGAQESVLASEMADIRKSVAARVAASEAAAAAARMEKARWKHEQRVNRLQVRLDEALAGMPRRRRRRGVR